MFNVFVVQVWVIAAREVFLTWGLCGAIVMQITSHNRYHHSLRRDIAVVIVVTLFVLLLSAFVASACVQIIHAHKFNYVTSSFGKAAFRSELGPRIYLRRARLIHSY